jgi:hypothetical protein
MIIRLSGLAMFLVFSISAINAQTPTPTAVDTTPVVTPAVAPAPASAPAEAAPAPAPEKAKNEKDGFNAHFRFGIRAGGIMSKTDFESDDPSEDPQSKIGGDLAILCAIPIGGGFINLQPELHWMQKGYKIEDAITGDNITSTLNYLELPLLLRVNFGGSIRVFAFAGPSVGYLLSGELNTATESRDATDYLDETEFNAHIGLGVGLGTFEVDIRYIAGLSDISDTEDLSDVKNSSIGAGITLKF